MKTISENSDAAVTSQPLSLQPLIVQIGVNDIGNGGGWGEFGHQHCET